MSIRIFGYGPNRYVCSALEEMRALTATLSEYSIERHIPIMYSLIEEVQVMVNRMEAGIQDKDDLEQLKKERAALIKECEKLQELVDEIKTTFPELNDDEEEDDFDEED